MLSVSLSTSMNPVLMVIEFTDIRMVTMILTTSAHQYTCDWAELYHLKYTRPKQSFILLQPKKQHLRMLSLEKNRVWQFIVWSSGYGCRSWHFCVFLSCHCFRLSYKIRFAPISRPFLNVLSPLPPLDAHEQEPPQAFRKHSMLRRAKNKELQNTIRFTRCSFFWTNLSLRCREKNALKIFHAMRL